jgi:hypothetical protein
MNSVASIAMTAVILGLSSLPASADTFNFRDRWVAVVTSGQPQSDPLPASALSAPPVTFSGDAYMASGNRGTNSNLFLGVPNARLSDPRSGTLSISFDSDLSSLTFNNVGNVPVAFYSSLIHDLREMVTPSTLDVTFLNNGVQVGSLVAPVANAQSPEERRLGDLTYGAARTFSIPDLTFSSAAFDQAVLHWTLGSRVMLAGFGSCDIDPQTGQGSCRPVFGEFLTPYSIEKLTYTVAVPEPSSYALLGLGLLLMGGVVRKRRSGNSPSVSV